MIPNRKVQDGIVENHSRSAKRAFVLFVRVANRNLDMQKLTLIVREAILETGKTLPESDIPIMVNVAGLDTYGTLLGIRYGIYAKDYPAVNNAIRTALRIKLQKNNIELIDIPSLFYTS